MPVNQSPDVERWLRQEVVATYDAVVADRSKTVTAAEAWEKLARHMDAAAKKG